MRKSFVFLALFLSFLIPAGAQAADESSVRHAFQARFPKLPVESVTRTPFTGVYEIVVDGQIFYTDEKATYLMSGNLLDLRSGEPKNLTQDATAKLAASSLAKSTDRAVKRVRGNGRRVIYTFEDPNCSYCRELQKELVKLNNVTIYTFLWPILSQDSLDKSRAIWCSSDRAKAWDDVMLRGATVARRECDTSALEKNAQLAQRFGIRGTPAVYVANGQQIGGYLTADKIEAALAAR